MSGVLRMAAFHLRAFVQTTFFVQLTITSTVSMVLLQALASYAFGGDGGEIWLRAGMFGCWSTTTVASGIIGFQRFQGTLPHLLLTPRTPAQTIAPVVASASLFGLVSFPLAAAVSAIVGHPPTFNSWIVTVGGALLFWLACFSLSCVVAALFVLTPNAITYEELLIAPLILLSGVFVLPSGMPSWLETVSLVLPTASAAQLMLDGDTLPVLLVALSIGASMLWLVAARFALAHAMRRATASGTLEVV